MSTTARAAVLAAPGRLELRQVELPRIGADDALLRVEACGICGTDLEQFRGAYTSFPAIPGHETVGLIAEIGDAARQRWQVAPGDRVAVFPRFGCGHCAQCAAGNARACPDGGLYGFTSTDRAPGLWGGYADYMYLAAGSTVRRFRPDIPAEAAVLFNPLGSGYKWAVTVPGTRAGDDVVILGCGQRGLACLIAAREAGARRIVITGTATDGHKLTLARELGADAAVDVESADVAGVVRDVTGGAGARVVVDTTPFATQPVIDAVEVAAPGGVVVLAGLKGQRPVSGLYTDSIVHKELTVIGVRGADNASMERAARLIESGAPQLSALHTHSFDIADAERALQTLAGEVPGARPISVTITPAGAQGAGPSAPSPAANPVRA